MGVVDNARKKDAARKALWDQIYRASLHDEGLRDAMDQVVLYYKLKYDEVPVSWIPNGTDGYGI